MLPSVKDLMKALSSVDITPTQHDVRPSPSRLGAQEGGAAAAALPAALGDYGRSSKYVQHQHQKQQEQGQQQEQQRQMEQQREQRRQEQRELQQQQQQRHDQGQQQQRDHEEQEQQQRRHRQQQQAEQQQQRQRQQEQQQPQKRLQDGPSPRIDYIQQRLEEESQSRIPIPRKQPAKQQQAPYSPRYSKNNAESELDDASYYTSNSNRSAGAKRQEQKPAQKPRGQQQDLLQNDRRGNKQIVNRGPVVPPAAGSAAHRNNKVAQEQLSLKRHEAEEKKLLEELYEIETRHNALLGAAVHKSSPGDANPPPPTKIAKASGVAKKEGVEASKVKLAFGPGAGRVVNLAKQAPAAGQAGVNIDKPKVVKKKKKAPEAWSDAAEDVQSIAPSEVSSQKPRSIHEVASIAPSACQGLVAGGGYLTKFHAKKLPAHVKKSLVEYGDGDDISELTSIGPSAVASEGNYRKFSSIAGGGGLKKDDMISLPPLAAALPGRLPSAGLVMHRGANDAPVKDRTFSAPSRIKTQEIVPLLPEIGKQHLPANGARMIYRRP